MFWCGWQVLEKSPLVQRVTVTCVLLAFAFCGLVICSLASSARVGLKNLIARELVLVENPIQENIEAVYVFGTGYKGTRRHLKRAADLYNQGFTDKILFFHVAGAMKYDRSLRKTLPRNAWVVHQLEKYGVPAFAAEPVAVPYRFFGTYTEADAVANEIVQRKLKSILLITSPYHTKRVRKCFDYFLNEKEVFILVSGSTDRGYLRDHLIEYLKLKFYEWFLL